MQIIDGYCNEPNIFADDIGEYNTAIWGTRDCVLPAGERLGYELVSNNEIKIKDGVFSTQGRRGVIKKGTAESCIIENGTQAENRNDLIVIEYAKDSSTLVESHTLKVIKGTPGEAATDPDVVTGDIQAGDVLHQMPLYRVKLEGLNVVAVERLFSVGNNAIGKEFDPDKDYEIGDLTLQYNKAWKFKVKHLAGAWDESQMEETDVLTELAAQNKNFGALTENTNDLLLEAATYSYGKEITMSWAELSVKIKTEDFAGLHIGDYKDIVLSTGEEVRVDLSGFNTYMNVGNTSILTAPHLYFTFRDCLKTKYQMNSTDTNTGGYGASALAKKVNETIYNTLPADLRAVMKEVQRLDNNKGTWAWTSRKLWLLQETEVFGRCNWSGSYDGGGIQLPIFAHSYRHIVKGLGKGTAESGSRASWWLASPSTSTTNFCRVDGSGNAGNDLTSHSAGVAPGFIIA